MTPRRVRFPFAASHLSGISDRLSGLAGAPAGRARLLAAAAWLALSGCIGGTSTEVGNPMTVEFLSDGRPVESTVLLRMVASGTDPEFYYEDPAETAPAPYARLVSSAGLEPTTILVPNGQPARLYREELEGLILPRERLALSKVSSGKRGASASEGLLPRFNLVIMAAGPKGETLIAWLPDLEDQGDGRGYRSSSGDSGSSFVLDLEPGRRCKGEADTTSPAGAPLALYVPGTPFYSLVREGRFEFKGLPGGRLPLRWITADGRIYSVPESLGVAGDGPAPAEYELSGPVHAGERLDSIAMPDPYPTLSAPEAEPAGPHVFSDSVVVSLDAPAGASIYYTLDGSTPERDPDQKYERPLVIRSSATLKAIAYATGFNPSPVAVNNYLLSPARPILSPTAGRYPDSVLVRITGPAGGVIRYTLDGNDPTEKSPSYANPFILRTSATVKAMAVIPGLGSSSVASADYVIESDSVTVSDTAAAAP